MSAVLWALLAAAAIVAELLTGTFYLLVLGLAAALAAGISWLDRPAAWQFAAFTAGSLAGFAVLRRRRALKADRHFRQDTGSRVEVVAVQHDGSLRVAYQGSHWDADLPAGEAAAVGDVLVVDRVAGIRLQCRRP